MDRIYTITACTKLESDEKGWPYFGSMRVLGWYEEFSDADEALRENVLDIYEYTYNYAVIEWVEPGLYPNIIDRQFYQWDPVKKGYRPITEPKFMKHFCNISMG